MRREDIASEPLLHYFFMNTMTLNTMINRLRGMTADERAYTALLAMVFTIPFSIALGQACAAVCLVLLVIALQQDRVRLRFPSVMGPVLAFLGIAIVLSWWCGDGAGVWRRCGKLLWFLLIPVTASLVHAPGRDRMLLMTFLGGCTLLGLKDLILHPLLAARSPVPDYLTSLIDKGSMTDGQMLMLGVVGCLFVLLTDLKAGRGLSWRIGVALSVQVAGLLINFKRGSWFCAIILIAVIILRHFRWRAWVLTLFILMGLFLLPPVQTRMGALKKEFNVEGGGRLTMWFKIVPSLIHDHPAGIGYGCLTNETMKKHDPKVEPNRNHLHANWAQVLVETGWAGLAIYLVWMIKTLSDGAAWVRRAHAGSGEAVWAGMSVLLLTGLMLNGLVEYNFGDTEMMIVYAVIMGLVAAMNQERKWPAL